eukprot:GHVP01053971.1.p1 GENE.GHVP01053971.1~~GHVP01053971.1.p1  ORF type:complete len:1027 (+),score=178.55 GHVP01053971.1:448-3528(+)
MEDSMLSNSIQIDEEDIIATQLVQRTQEPILGAPNFIYDSLTKKKIFIKEIIQEWTELRQEKPDNAIDIFFSFLVKAAGSNTIWNGDKTNAGVELMTIGEKTAKEYTGNIFTSKNAKIFRKNFGEFVRKLLSETEISDTISLLNEILPFICTMSSSVYRPFRQIATFTAMLFMEHLAHTETVLSDTKKKAESNKKDINSIKEKLEIIFNGIFMHRYRDVDPFIRSDSITGLTKSILNNTKHYLEGIYLRYIGWLLSDQAKEVRSSALTSFGELIACGLYSKSFFERFIPRFIEICNQDPYDSVRITAINLITPLYKANLLSNESQTELGSLVFDASINIRRRAGSYVSLWLQQNENIQKSIYVLKKSPQEDQDKIEQLSGGANFCLVLSQLSEFLSIHTNHLGNPQSYADVLIDALSEYLPAVKNYKGMAEIFLLDESEFSEQIRDNFLKCLSDDISPYTALIFGSASRYAIYPLTLLSVKDRKRGRKRKVTEDNTEESSSYLFDKISNIISKNISCKNNQILPPFFSVISFIFTHNFFNPSLQNNSEKIIKLCSKCLLVQIDKNIHSALGDLFYSASKIDSLNTILSSELERTENELKSIAENTLNEIKHGNSFKLKNHDLNAVLLCIFRRLRTIGTIGIFSDTLLSDLKSFVEFLHNKDMFDELYQESLHLLSQYKESNCLIFELCRQTITSAHSFEKRLFSFYLFASFITDGTMSHISLEKNEIEAIESLSSELAEKSVNSELTETPKVFTSFIDSSHPFFCLYNCLKFITVVTPLIYTEQLSSKCLSNLFSLYNNKAAPFPIEDSLMAAQSTISKKKTEIGIQIISNAIEVLFERNKENLEDSIKTLWANTSPKNTNAIIEHHIQLLEKIKECDISSDATVKNYKYILQIYDKNLTSGFSTETKAKINGTLNTLFNLPPSNNTLYGTLKRNLKNIIKGCFTKESIQDMRESYVDPESETEVSNSKDILNNNPMSSELFSETIFSPTKSKDNTRKSIIVSSDISFASSPVIRRTSGSNSFNPN